jgi:RNA polymerase sigma factor (sigma-70 family)
LTLAFSQGSSDAFTPLFSRYKQPLFGFFRRRLSDASLAEELTQETFLVLLRSASRYEPRALFRTYLYAIAFKIVRASRKKFPRVRGEIEEMEAEQKSLEHRVDFATIELRLSEEYKAQLNNASPSASTRIHNSLVAGYRNAAETLLGFVLFFAESGPTLLIWLVILLAPAWLLFRHFRRAAGVI